MYMYDKATKKKFDVLIINLDKSGNERYRHNYLDYIQIEWILYIIIFLELKNLIVYINVKMYSRNQREEQTL